jgi:murein DD-endopeptidase MepM/ murein hydrolase activator NlpD
MAKIVNNFDYPVILVDNRDWATSWANHKKRKSAGGADLAYPFGKPVKAPMSGLFTYTEGKGSGGNIGRLAASDNTVIEFMHLSGRLVPNNSWVELGQEFVLSGASGYGKAFYYAPHLHTHALISGVRTPLHTLFSASIAPAGTTKTPITAPTQEEDDDMGHIFPIVDATGKAVAQGYGGPGGFYTIENEQHLKLLQRYIERSPKAVFLAAERAIVDGYVSGTRPHS